MKKLILSTVVLCLAVLFTSCSKETMGLNGSGKTIPLNVDFEGFNQVEFDGMIGNVTLSSRSSSSSITGSIDDNLAELLIFKQVNQTLYVSIANNSRNALYITSNLLDLQISAPFINSIRYEGNGSLEINMISGQDLDLEKNGNASVVINGNTAGKLDLNIAGNGDFSSKDLRAETMNILKYGNGDMQIYTDNPFKLIGNGNGDVINNGKGVLAEGSNYGGNGNVKILKK